MQDISASIESLRGGCLPGDTLPIQVFVSHIRAVKSLQGIIITLYRLARVDTHPAIPLGAPQEGKKPEYEDYYPKSRTGLGGLSLSSAGSSRSFRQDLNQTFVPLIVDPSSLTATVKSSIKVPDDVFPTISNVPGQMISFRYYVEVVVDLRGKIASQERVRSQFGMVNGATGYGNGDPKVSGINGSSGLVFPLASGFGCLDTSQIRRERSVVWWPFEVVVGTRNSERRRYKQHEDLPSTDITRTVPPHDINRDLATTADPGTSQSSTNVHSYRHDSDEYLNVSPDTYSSPQYTDRTQTTNVPPPELEEPLDEKARLQRAEERLLPSAPPDDVGPSTADLPQPSAPEAIDYEDFVDRYRMYQPVNSGPPAPSPKTIVPSSSCQRSAEEHASTELQLAPSEPSEDKQELE